MYDLGTRIKEAREKRGLSQRELAERINRSVPTISNSNFAPHFRRRGAY